MSTMLIPETGKRIEWDPQDEVSVEKAKEAFDQAAGGNLAFAANGGVKEQIRSFDPQAEEIVITRPLVGG